MKIKEMYWSKGMERMIGGVVVVEEVEERKVNNLLSI